MANGLRQRCARAVVVFACLASQTQRPKDSDFEKYFLRKSENFRGSDCRHKDRKTEPDG